MPILCPNPFQGLEPLTVSVTKSGGGEVLVYAKNNSRSIIFIKRMLLRMEWGGGGATTLYIREGGFFDFFIGGERLEQGTTHLKFRTGPNSAVRGEASAEYIEATSRSRSELNEFNGTP